MKSQVMSQFTEIWLPSTALIIFVSIFLGMLFYVFIKTSKQEFKEIAELPLQEGSKDE